MTICENGGKVIKEKTKKSFLPRFCIFLKRFALKVGSDIFFEAKIYGKVFDTVGEHVVMLFGLFSRCDADALHKRHSYIDIRLYLHGSCVSFLSAVCVYY
jgi:hypothetical protein